MHLHGIYSYFTHSQSVLKAKYEDTSKSAEGPGSEQKNWEDEQIRVAHYRCVKDFYCHCLFLLFFFIASFFICLTSSLITPLTYISFPNSVGAKDAAAQHQEKEYDFVFPEDMAETFVMATTIAGTDESDDAEKVSCCFFISFDSDSLSVVVVFQ